MPTEAEVKALADAMFDLLDDMQGGKCVCGLAKAQARIALEPFIGLVEAGDSMDGIINMDEARRIVSDCDY